MRLRIVISAAALLLGAGAALPAAENAAGQSESVSVLEMLALGYQFSPVITVIFGLFAFAALFLVFHIVLSTREALTTPGPLFRGMLDDLASGDVEAAQRRAEESQSLFGRLTLPGLKLHGHPLERIQQAMEGSGRRCLGLLRQEAAFLANIGVLSPMLGLLGTVLGLMRGFKVMGEEDFVQGAKSIMLQSAVGQAMTTTAVGLIVGIPAMAAYYLCMSRIGRVADELEIAAEEVTAAVGEMKRHAAPAVPAAPEGQA